MESCQGSHLESGICQLAGATLAANPANAGLRTVFRGISRRLFLLAAGVKFFEISREGGNVK